MERLYGCSFLTISHRKSNDNPWSILWGFPKQWGIQKMDGFFHGKILHFSMDDEQGVKNLWTWQNEEKSSSHVWLMEWEKHGNSQNSKWNPPGRIKGRPTSLQELVRHPTAYGNFWKTPYPWRIRMYAIYGIIDQQYTPNAGIYTIHGSYGIMMINHDVVSPTSWFIMVLSPLCDCPLGMVDGMDVPHHRNDKFSDRAEPRKTGRSWYEWGRNNWGYYGILITWDIDNWYYGILIIPYIISLGEFFAEFVGPREALKRPLPPDLTALQLVASRNFFVNGGKSQACCHHRYAVFY